jgi:hypothetical protein
LRRLENDRQGMSRKSERFGTTASPVRFRTICR